MVFWGPEPRSTYHKTTVRRVNHYLKQKCSKADYELELVSGYRTDAFGYDRKSKTWYLCEIKVDPSDLKKAPQQILDTKFHFPKTRYYHIGDTIVPVIAIPARLANYLVKQNEWTSLRNTCKMVKAALWVVEQSTVREIMGPKTKKAVKTKSAKASTAKKKVTRTKKPTSKKRAVKSKRPKVKTAKAKSAKLRTTKAKTNKPKSRAVKSTKTKRIKRKASRKTSTTRRK
jgi:hypothetical protein